MSNMNHETPTSIWWRSLRKKEGREKKLTFVYVKCVGRVEAKREVGGDPVRVMDVKLVRELDVALMLGATNEA